MKFLIILAMMSLAIQAEVFITCSNISNVLAEYKSDKEFYVIGRMTGKAIKMSRREVELEGFFCQYLTKNNHLYPKDHFMDLRNYIKNSTNPTVSQFLTRTYIAYSAVWKEHLTFVELMEMYSHFIQLLDYNLFWYIGMASILISFVRFLLNRIIFKPYSERLMLPKRDVNKLVSSMWLTLASTCLWLQTLRVVILSGRKDFHETLTILDNVRFDMGYFIDQLPSDYFWLYVVQIGFYVSAVINLFFLDYWREDKVVITIHHVVTISLLFISYNIKLHVIGAITLLLHDINDIFLELGKANVYLKFKYKRYNPINDTLATICYILFMASWALTRLYWFPFKVLYATAWGAYITHIGREIFFFIELNTLLWILFVIHIYWSYLIANLAFKILTGKMKNLGDIRETDIDYDEDPEDVLKKISKKTE